MGSGASSLEVASWFWQKIYVGVQELQSTNRTKLPVDNKCFSKIYKRAYSVHSLREGQGKVLRLLDNS